MARNNKGKGQYMDLDRLHTPYQAYHDEPEEYSDDEAPPNYPVGGPGGDTPSVGETPGGVMIHMVPEGSKTRWSHIDDLDSFFKKVYKYHQKAGFRCMMLQVRSLELYLGGESFLTLFRQLFIPRNFSNSSNSSSSSA